MTGNLSDLRTGLPAQTVLKEGAPFHEPMRLLTIIEAPFEHARRAVEAVANINNLVENGWLRMVIIDPETHLFHAFSEGTWQASEAGDNYQEYTREQSQPKPAQKTRNHH